GIRTTHAVAAGFGARTGPFVPGTGPGCVTPAPQGRPPRSGTSAPPRAQPCDPTMILMALLRAAWPTKLRVTRLPGPEPAFVGWVSRACEAEPTIGSVGCASQARLTHPT